MKKILLLLFPFVFYNSGLAQSAADAAVQLMASVQNSPAQITLSWVGNASSTQYQVSRKLKGALSWGAPMATLNGSLTQYVDATAVPGTSYEYRVVRIGGNYTGYGYINAGIQVPAIENRGKLILLVDSTFIAPLASEITRLVADIEGDGWDVIRHNVDRTGSVYHVKDLILGDFAVDSFRLKAVLIVGHVPVPYSGNINPDGHGDHLGAWPADCYYGDIDGVWTDNLITSTTASPARTQNVPGDGKFDQSVIPSDLELQVGRVDFANLPAFALSEQQLLKNYLDKNHDYRKKMFVPVSRAVIDDNFGYFSGEAFAASGYKAFAPLVGASSVTVADYFTAMGAGSYQWSFGCGGGTYVSASGIGNTTNFASANLQGVFTLLFGSYFGDWDSQNNFLRAPLAQGKILTSLWSGRPHYYFHHMGQGENIGYSLLISQNYSGPGSSLYYGAPTGISGRWVHTALMGDPTLRQDIVAPVASVVATKVGNDCHISWSASTQSNVIGYNVYVKNDSITSYTRLNNNPVAGTTYTDFCLQYKSIYHYMVRAVVLENNYSGSYYNQSEGLADTAYNAGDFANVATFTASQVGNVVTFSALTNVQATYSWTFGNGTNSTLKNPVVTYTNNGNYVVTLVANSSCLSDTSTAYIYITEVGLAGSYKNHSNPVVFPNPSGGVVFLNLSGTGLYELSVSDALGRSVHRQMVSTTTTEINLSPLPKGIYFLTITNAEGAWIKKIVLE